MQQGIRELDASLAGLGGCPFAPGASGNTVTEDLVFMLQGMGYDTGIDLPALIASRRVLSEALPDEPLYGCIARAGLPLDFALSTNVGYSIQGYTFSGGYQKVSGDTAYAYVGGTDTYLFSEQQVSTFALANERAWMLRYDYNFAALGIPGLTLNVRYVKGDQVKPQRITSAKGRALAAGDGEGREWERTTDITYVVQSGPLRHVSLRWRNASMRSNFADAADENRVIVGYTFEF